MGLREEDIKTFDDHEGIYLFLGSSSSKEEEEDDDCFFGKGENDRVRLRGLIYLCVRGGMAICLL